MTTLEIPDIGKSCTTPSSWDELTADQVCYIMKLYDRVLRSELSLLDFNVRVLYYLMGMRHGWRSVRWEKLASISEVDNRNANIYMLCERCLEWLFKEADGKAVLNYSSVVNPLPSVKPGLFRRRLFGPADALQDLSFGEFRHAATALNVFFKSQNTDDLDECIAHLYRVRARQYNRAGRFVEDITNNNMSIARKRVSRMKDWQKTLIMLWFASCINYLQTGTVQIDGEDVDMSRLFSSEKSKDGELSCTWQDLTIAIAKEQTIGNMERVDEEPLYSIIGIMWHNYKDNKRHEKIGKTN